MLRNNSNFIIINSMVILLMVIAPKILLASGYAQFPLQGRLLDTQGRPLNGPSQVQFTIKEIAGSTSISIWQESQTVTFVNGVFSISLGVISPLTSRMTSPGTHVFADGTKKYSVALQIGTTAFPDIPILPTPFAMSAGLLEGKPGSFYRDISNLTGTVNGDQIQITSGGATLSAFAQQTQNSLNNHSTRLLSLETSQNSQQASLLSIDDQLNNATSGARPRLVTAETQLISLNTRLTSAEGTLNTLSQTVSDPNTGLAKTRSDLNALTTRVAAVEPSVVSLQTTVNNLATTVNALQTTVNNLQASITTLNSKVDALERIHEDYAVFTYDQNSPSLFGLTAWNKISGGVSIHLESVNYPVTGLLERNKIVFDNQGQYFITLTMIVPGNSHNPFLKLARFADSTVTNPLLMIQASCDANNTTLSSHSNSTILNVTPGDNEFRIFVDYRRTFQGGVVIPQSLPSQPPSSALLTIVRIK